MIFTILFLKFPDFVFLWVEERETTVHIFSMIFQDSWKEEKKDLP